MIKVAAWPVMLLSLPYGVADSQPRHDSYHRLDATQIRKTLVSHQFTDEVHWAERYRPDGTIEGASMGRTFVKNWRVQANELCIRDTKGEICYEVWRAGKTVEFRRSGGDDFPRAGIIRP